MLACRSGSLSAVCPRVPSGVCILSKDYGFVSAADFYAKQIVVYRTCMCERVCVREGVFEKRLKRNKKKNGVRGVGGVGREDSAQRGKPPCFRARCEVATLLADNRLSAISAEQHQWIFFVCRLGGAQPSQMQPNAVAGKLSRTIVK